MADPISRFRTNYFSLADEAKFKALMDVAGFNLQNGKLWQNDEGKYAFGSQDGDLPDSIAEEILLAKAHPDKTIPVRAQANHNEYGRMIRAWCDENGIDVSEYEDADTWEREDAFVDLLQPLIPKDDCIVVMEIGYEKLRSLWAHALILTKTEGKLLTLEDHIYDELEEIMGEKFKTQLSC